MQLHGSRGWFLACEIDGTLMIPSIDNHFLGGYVMRVILSMT
jgi:hypothetical protein